MIIDGTTLSLDFITPFTDVVGALMILIGAFDRYLWRLKILQGWFVKKPDLNGTWIVRLSSSYKKYTNKKTKNEITAYLAIRQNFSDVRLRFMTKESFSEVLSADLSETEDKTYKLITVYRNEPRIQKRNHSPIHHGALILYIPEMNPSSMKGFYWTDRSTKGEVKVFEKRKKVLSDYNAAKKLFKNK
ncbi:MAG: hypothetical protein GYA51_12595 [Candidatus Methanofastidiosa archaeon]|nr:hypothetical protein [Candidatus Methanofastidiosa archaeon]